jgi:hypothetical protein
VAQILEHLGLVEARITGLLQSEAEAARAAGVGPESNVEPILAGIDLSRMTDRSTPIVSMPSGDPVRGLSWVEAGDALRATRQRLLAVIESVDSLDLGRRQVAHRVFGDLSLYEWIALVGAHELRHAEQIGEIAARR